MIRLKQEHLKIIIHYSTRDYPIESCGVIAGQEGVSGEVYPIPNVDKSPVSYFMDIEEMFNVFRDMRRKNLSLIGFYHSHPYSEAYPSEKDVELAYYSEAIYLIISFIRGLSKPEIKAFHLLKEMVSEEEIQIL